MVRSNSGGFARVIPAKKLRRFGLVKPALLGAVALLLLIQLVPYGRALPTHR